MYKGVRSLCFHWRPMETEPDYGPGSEGPLLWNFRCGIGRRNVSKPVRVRSFAFIAAAAGAAGLASCATYQPLPLPHRTDLRIGMASLETTSALGAGYGIPDIDIRRPLTVDQISLLAILNDPDLKSERGTIDVAGAGVVKATIIPNPMANFSYGALISGPATTSSLSAALSQSLAAIITQHARYKAAKFHFYQVGADELWREWLVAEKARQLAADIHSVDRSIALMRQEIVLLSQELAGVKKAISAGNLTLAAEAPLAAAQAVAENSLVTLKLSRLKNWQALDSLLGLDPKVRFRIVRPVFDPLPRNIESLVADLPERRPDLAALRLGYDSADEDVRAAILGQFPAVSLGGSYNKDTSEVVTAGPTFDFALPVFDRNQAQVARTTATRILLRAQYQARLDRAVANVRALVAQIHQLSMDLMTARNAAAAAQALAKTARQAYAQNNLDQRTVTDYETTALERRSEIVTIERQINEDNIFVGVELGIGLPKARIALSVDSVVPRRLNKTPAAIREPL
jgi:outer membrane protein, heavy metal efflux system